MADDVAVPDLEIRVNGALLPPQARADVISVRVEEDVEALSMFTLVIRNWDAELLQVTWSDSSVFAVGNEVRISLGFVDDLHPVMIGEISGLEPEFTATDAPILTVRGYDHRHRLTRGRITRTFAKTKDSVIAGTIARAAGLRAEVTDSKTVHDLVVQSNATNLDFLQERARLIGYEIYVQDKVLHFHPPPLTGNPEVTLTLGADLTGFSPRLSSLGQGSGETVRGWDFRKKEAIVARAGADQVPSMGGRLGGSAADQAFHLTTADITVDLPVAGQAEADQLARGRYLDRCLEYIRGEGECSGQPQLRAGRLVKINGVGKRFSGTYYLTGVSHQLTTGEGFLTTFEVRRSSEQ